MSKSYVLSERSLFPVLTHIFEKDCYILISIGDGEQESVISVKDKNKKVIASASSYGLRSTWFRLMSKHYRKLFTSSDLQGELALMGTFDASIDTGATITLKPNEVELMIKIKNRHSKISDLLDLPAKRRLGLVPIANSFAPRTPKSTNR